MTNDTFDTEEERPRIVLHVSTGESPGEVRIVARPDSFMLAGRGRARVEHFEEPEYALARRPAAFLEELGEALLEDLGRALEADSVEQVFPADSADDRMLELWIEDEGAARLPWELATWNDVPIRNQAVPVRLARSPMPDSSEPVRSPLVFVHILAERKDRGHTLELLQNEYETAGGNVVLPGRDWFYAPDLREIELPSEARVVHLVVEPGQRRGEVLFSGGEIRLTARHLVPWLDDGSPRLLVLDLALNRDDIDAAQQLMLANSLSWTVSRAVTEVSVISGVFGASNDHLPHLHELVKRLAQGRKLVEVAGALQRFKPRMPLRSDSPLRSAVALSTASPRQSFRLGG